MLQTGNVTEMTLYETISGLHDIAPQKSNLAGEGLDSFLKRRGIITEIADEFCGGTRYARQKSRSLAGAMLRESP